MTAEFVVRIVPALVVLAMTYSPLPVTRRSCCPALSIREGLGRFFVSRPDLSGPSRPPSCSRSLSIRLTRGKTNRQYLREIRRRPRLVELLEMTMIAFEDVFFGHHALGRARFESCYHRLDEFETQVREAVV